MMKQTSRNESSDGFCWQCRLDDESCNSTGDIPNGQETTVSDTDPKSWTVLRAVFRRPATDRRPGDLVSELRTPSPSLYVELRKYLKDPDWARVFVKENGVETLLETLKSLHGRNSEEVQLKVECGQCLRLVMDSRVGLDYIMENADYTQKLATALDTDDIPVKKQVFELLSALCVYRPDGYTRALETFEHCKNLKKHRYRFQLVVDEMKSSEVVEYTTALVAFVNCVIISPTSLNDRIRIRNEFLGLKILDVLNRFRKQCKEGSNSDLAVQLDVFDEQRSTDEGQFSGPDGVDLSSHMDVFFAILRQVAETPQEIPFLSILQHLLRTDLSQPLSELVWETAETLVHRATLLESKQEADRLLRASNLGGLMRCHCSCHYRQNAQTIEDCDATPSKKNRPNQLSFCSPDGTRTPCLLLSPNQNYPPPTPFESVSSPTSCNTNDAHRPQCKGPLLKNSFPYPNGQFSVESQEGPSKSNAATNNNCHNSVSSLSQSFKTVSNHSSQNQETNRIAPVQCDNVPSSKTLHASDSYNCDNVENVNCDQTVSDRCSNVKNTDVGDVVSLRSNVIPPPPPPPPPPMANGLVFSPPPPPPPPPPATLRVSAETKIIIPVTTTLPQQNTPKPKTKMKSFNWSKIHVSKVIGKDNLWSRVAKDHTESLYDLDFDAMEKLFCQQAVATNGHISPKFGDSAEGIDKRKKEIQEINLLDGKRSLNINIFLKQFRSSHEGIVRILEDGAHEDLGAERLRGLLKILPESDEVELLKNFDGDKTKLGNAEKFLLQLIGVQSYKLRIESMLLKEEFMGNQEFLENSIETIRCAAQELEECKRLHEVLYMVLVAGNFLNAGGYAGDAAGFKMLSLLKLTDIRANKPSMTLIHYVAEQVFKKQPDLLEFLDEVQNLDEASRISMETLKTDVSSLCQRVSKVSTQVAEAEEQIRLQMQDFIEFAESKVETIQNEINNLESVRQRLGDFLCEDTSTFKLEDCFKVFHSFCSRFKSALQENERRQKQEKLAEARRAQRERQIALKRRSLELSDCRSGTDGDHIMDQLLGDIRSGFPERQLGDIFRRSRRSYDPDENAGRHRSDEKSRLENTLKRHSDPAMLEKCVGSNYNDDKSTAFKSRRARFMEENSGENIMGYLQNPSLIDAEMKERRSFGSADDSLERTSFRRSGRRKRIEHLNGETQSRERSGSSPPLAILTSATDQETELNSKQRLKAKINEWMLQNEREQRRDWELQLKLQQERKKRQMNGQILTNGEVTIVDKGILEEIDETDSRQLLTKQCDNDILKVTKSPNSKQNESFTQKIIGLLNAAANESAPFTKTRLYHSTREKRSTKNELEEKSKDDSQICSLNEKQNSLQINNSSDHMDSSSNSDQDLKEVEGKPLESNFDRFSATRKTQRRLKLREMRLEAENAIKTVKQEKKIILATNGETSSALSPSNPSTDDSLSVASEVNSPQTTGDIFNQASINNTKECNIEAPLRTPTDNIAEGNSSNGFCSNNSSENKDVVSGLSRQRNTSLRSRQSRLARRINSLSTPLTSPEVTEINSIIPESKNSITNSVKPEAKSLVNDIETIENANFSRQEKKDENSQQGKPNESHNSRTEQGNPSKSLRDNDFEKPPKEHPKKQSNEEIRKVNGHVSHKVTVSTETKSKVVVPKSNMTRQTSRASTSLKSRTPSQKGTNIPSVIRTTQNVKVQQTIHRQSLVNSKTVTQMSEVNGKRDSKPQFKNNTSKLSSPVPSPLISKKVQAVTEEQNSCNITNGRIGSIKNGKGSPSSSISSVCSLSTNIKLIKNEKSMNGKLSNPVNTKKITINHNGSVKFLKESNSSNKVTQNLSNSNTASKSEKNVSARKKAFI